MDVRQDKELQEIRASVQDLIVLFFQESAEDDLLLVPTPSYTDSAPDIGFSAAQADLKALIELKSGRASSLEGLNGVIEESYGSSYEENK